MFGRKKKHEENEVDTASLSREEMVEDLFGKAEEISGGIGDPVEEEIDTGGYDPRMEGYEYEDEKIREPLPVRTQEPVLEGQGGVPLPDDDFIAAARSRKKQKREKPPRAMKAKKEKPPKRSRKRERGTTGGIDDLGAEMDFSVPIPDTSAEPEFDEPLPEFDELGSETRAAVRSSTAKAKEKSRMDDKTRMKVFNVACTAAGVFGVLAVAFATVAIVRGIKPAPQAYADSGAQYGDQLHVNVFVDEEGNVYYRDDEGNPVDPTTGLPDPNGQASGNGNPQTQSEPSTEPGGETQSGSGEQSSETQPGSGGETQPGSGETQSGGTVAVPGESQSPLGGGTSAPDVSGQRQEITPEQEQKLLEAMHDRIAAGGSGYSESDVIYSVQEGDTLTKVSAMCGFSVDFLAEYNHIKDKDLIITSESLRYPSFIPE